MNYCFVFLFLYSERSVHFTFRHTMFLGVWGKWSLGNTRPSQWIDLSILSKICLFNLFFSLRLFSFFFWDQNDKKFINMEIKDVQKQTREVPEYGLATRYYRILHMIVWWRTKKTSFVPVCLWKVGILQVVHTPFLQSLLGEFGSVGNKICSLQSMSPMLWQPISLTPVDWAFPAFAEIKWRSRWPCCSTFEFGLWTEPTRFERMGIPIGYGAQSQVVGGRYRTVYPHSLDTDAACPWLEGSSNKLSRGTSWPSAALSKSRLCSRLVHHPELQSAPPKFAYWCEERLGMQFEPRIFGPHFQFILACLGTANGWVVLLGSPHDEV